MNSYGLWRNNGLMLTNKLFKALQAEPRIYPCNDFAIEARMFAMVEIGRLNGILALYYETPERLREYLDTLQFGANRLRGILERQTDLSRASTLKALDALIEHLNEFPNTNE